MSRDPARGIDQDPARRPGVPAEKPPHSEPHARNVAQMRQDGRPTGASDARTPVFGTAQPPHGLSGRLRTTAYRIPDHFARHWLLLILADRVEVLERRVRRRPGLAAAAGLGTVLGTLALTRALGRR
jgi:hypothetical protein